MAEYLQKNFNPSINVKIEINENMGYAPVSKLRLSATKLRNLGWMPRYGLKEIFERLIAFFKASDAVL
jgi:nucleoside-diphosphate-sugar epimerase